MKKFIELIQRIHQERYSVVIQRIVDDKLPVTCLSVSPLNDAIKNVRSLRSQGVNVNILITNSSFRPSELREDFRIVHLSDISRIYPCPEYILAINNIDARVAVKNSPQSKVLSVNRGNQDAEYNIFMNHLTELQEVYESLNDELSRRTFCGYWLSRISNQIGEIVYSKNAHYLIPGFIPENGAIVIDGGVFDVAEPQKFLLKWAIKFTALKWIRKILPLQKKLLMKWALL